MRVNMPEEETGVPHDHPHLLLLDENLRQSITRNGHIPARAVEHLYANGCRTEAMFHMLGCADNMVLARRNLGRYPT